MFVAEPFKNNRKDVKTVLQQSAEPFAHVVRVEQQLAEILFMERKKAKKNGLAN